ncbi:porin family protein [Vibrio sp. SM6]|uniref:Porin family protein n=2 Tax=Vibrio agarilyticus TaxID=2726741 RepID=A0A7X8TQ21_9VIBR|nr:porin family protein [Vibrio agarilyticus]
MHSFLSFFRYATLLTVFTCHAASAKGPHEFYAHVGVSTFSAGDRSENGLYTQAGYNYFFSPFLALDINYSDANSFNKDLSPSDPAFTSQARGFGVGAKLMHDVGRIILQAKAGISYLKITHDYWDNSQLAFVETKDNHISPYAEIGIGVLSPWTKNLIVNINYQYQVASDEIDISSISLSGQYFF